jgi:hypothetical protein
MEILITDESYELCAITFMSSPERLRKVKQILVECDASIEEEQLIHTATRMVVLIPLPLIETFKGKFRSL